MNNTLHSWKNSCSHRFKKWSFYEWQMSESTCTSRLTSTWTNNPIYFSLNQNDITEKGKNNYLYFEMFLKINDSTQYFVTRCDLEGKELYQRKQQFHMNIFYILTYTRNKFDSNTVESNVVFECAKIFIGLSQQGIKTIYQRAHFSHD